MGSEYERWLIARGNVFAPGAEAVVKLIAKLRAEGWLVEPSSPTLAQLELRGAREEHARGTGAYAVRRIDHTFGSGRDALLAKIAASTEPLPAALTSAWMSDEKREDLSLVWPVSTAAPVLKYPLTRRPEGPVAYRLQLHRAADFVYPISETIEPLDGECRCGNDLSFEWDPAEVENPFGATTGLWSACGDCSQTYDPSKETARVCNPFDRSEVDVPGGAAYRFALKVECGKRFVADPSLAFAPELVALVSEVFGRDFYEVASMY